MLIEVRCPRFRRGPIRYGDGLNVVLGDEVASNSIGKSTALMIVDFAFGGKDLLDLTPEVAERLGDHHYDLFFEFEGVRHGFRRYTGEPSIVHVLADDGIEVRQLRLTQYTDWLGRKYRLRGTGVSFRRVVAPFVRVWKRPTTSPERPLRSADRQPDSEAIDTLLMLFDRFDELQTARSDLKDTTESLKALRRAQKAGHVPKIKARQYRENSERIASAHAELDEIRENLARFAIGVTELLNRDILDFKREKDRLLAERVTVRARLARLEASAAVSRRHRRADFDSLREYLPDIDEARLDMVEDFHQGISSIMRRELQQAKKETESELLSLDSRLEDLTKRIDEALKPVPNPGQLVDRVLSVAGNAAVMKEANKFHDDVERLKVDLAEKEAHLERQEERSLDQVAAIVNADLRARWSEIYGAGRSAPALALAPKSYGFEVPQDTGTGTAYAAVVALDLALLAGSQLPFIVHDSLLFKNVEDEAMVGIIDQYAEVANKQVFIAIDQVRKYGAKTGALIERATALKLAGDALLYDFDWREEKARPSDNGG